MLKVLLSLFVMSFAVDVVCAMGDVDSDRNKTLSLSDLFAQQPKNTDETIQKTQISSVKGLSCEYLLCQISRSNSPRKKMLVLSFEQELKRKRKLEKINRMVNLISGISPLQAAVFEEPFKKIIENNRVDEFLTLYDNEIKINLSGSYSSLSQDSIFSISSVLFKLKM